jgi:hypothetical protein
MSLSNKKNSLQNILHPFFVENRTTILLLPPPPPLTKVTVSVFTIEKLPLIDDK